jgi:hypothetical protein
MGFPREACSGVSSGKTPIEVEARVYTHREHAQPLWGTDRSMGI